MTDDSFIDSMIEKLEKAKKTDDPDTRKTKIRETKIFAEMAVQEKKFSEILREKMEEEDKTYISLSQLEDRAEDIEKTITRFEESDEIEEDQALIMEVYSREGLEMLQYEVSRFKKLAERGSL